MRVGVRAVLQAKELYLRVTDGNSQLVPFVGLHILSKSSDRPSLYVEAEIWNYVVESAAQIRSYRFVFCERKLQSIYLISSLVLIIITGIHIIHIYKTEFSKF